MVIVSIISLFLRSKSLTGSIKAIDSIAMLSCKHWVVLSSNIFLLTGGSIIRVALIMGRMGDGGAEAIVMNYMRHLRHSDIQFALFAHEGSPFPQRRELETLGVRVILIPPYTRPARYLRVLIHMLRQGRYDIAHAHISTMNVFPLFAAWRAGIPVRISHAHTTGHRGEGLKNILKMMLRPCVKLLATRYFACGELVSRWNYGARATRRNEVYIMPNAIDPAFYAYDAQARLQIRTAQCLDEDALGIGHVGRFVYQKNHAFLLDVFAQICRLRENAVLFLAGDGELRAEMEKKAAGLGLEGRVRFLGALDDVSGLYSAMDVFVLPSFYEGLPVSVLEAQANGLPCILSTEVTAEVLTRDNVSRLSLASPTDQWAETILSAHRLPGGVDARFDINKQAEGLAGEYLQLVSITARRGVRP